MADPHSRLEVLEALQRRGWRVVFVSAALLYLVGSHWPRLEMDPVGTAGASPDKILHFIAFLLLTLPACWTGWFRGLFALWCAGLGFAIFDEVTQWLLPIERSLAVEDLLCDACGVTAGVAILAASRPMRDPTSLRIAAQRRLAEATLLARASNWMVLAATAALGVVVLVPIGVLASEPLRIEARAMAVAGAALGAAIAGMIALEFGIGGTLLRLRASAACLRCGSAAGADDAVGPCGSCGATRRANDWFDAPRPPLGVRFDAAWWPLLRAGLAAAFVIAAMGWLGAAWRQTPDHATVAQVVDVAVLFVAGAWGVHGARRRLSAILHAAGRCCVVCGHDLRGHSGGAEVVECPECGTPFQPATTIGLGDEDSTTETHGKRMHR